MIIETTQKAETGFEFMPAGMNGRKTNFGILNPVHATGHENYDEAVISKFVMFGKVASDMNDAWASGYRTFKIERGKPRDNNWLTDEGELRESKEIIVREFKPLAKGKVSAEQAEEEASRQTSAEAI